MSLPLVVIQVAFILATCRLAGRLARPLRQPGVVGEMAAGLILGPSFFGAFFPQTFQRLFPADTISDIEWLGRLGLFGFMFLVGLRTDVRVLAASARRTAVISVASIGVPFLLGIPLAVVLYPAFAGPEASAAAFVVFFCAALSVTALPVLARILARRGLIGTPVGTLALSCAAVDDAVAWALLAVASASHGLHPLFVAFALGVIVPRGWSRLRSFADRLDPLLAAALLPLFFAVTGLRTQVGLLDTPALWGIAAVVLLVAIAGKAGGCAAAARLSGVSPPDALSLGILMNARGLMELVFLNAGRELGLISPELFAIMVLMALITTVMTSPLLDLLTPPRRLGEAA